MSALNVKIDNRARGSGATRPKLTAYKMYGLGLALSYIYNAFLCIPILIKLFIVLPMDAADTLLVHHVKSMCVCQFVHTFWHPL